MDKHLYLQRIQAVNSMLKDTPVPHESWRQHIIRTAVKYCYAMYPEMMSDHRNVVGRHKENLKDQKFATATESKAELRALFNIPIYLNQFIHALISHFLPDEPMFCEEEDEVIWFFKEYPQFRIAEYN